MARPAMVPAAVLVEDLDFYPRAAVDATHVTDIARALAAGIELPPVIADRASRRLVDGFHRRRAVLKHNGPDSEIAVFWRDYESDADMYAEAVQLNSGHGRKFSSYDRVRITIRAAELGLTNAQVAVLLHYPEEVVERLAVQVAHSETGATIALKRPVRHLAGLVLNAQQETVNRRSSGWSVGYHANQIVDHIEAGTVEITPDLAVTLIRLRDTLIGLALELPAQED